MGEITSIAELKKMIAEKIELGQIELILPYIGEFEASVRGRLKELEDREKADFYDVTIAECDELRRVLGDARDSAGFWVKGAA